MSKFDCIVVGAGFSGLYALFRLRALGCNVKVLEKAPDIGGTWFWNCYPGAACDVESLDYSYSFDSDLQNEWTWSRKFPTQKEILSYLHHVAKRFDLKRDIIFNTKVNSIQWDNETSQWHIKSNTGEEFISSFVIMGTGCLSVAKEIDIKGWSSYTGEAYHTSNWPQGGVDLNNKRVAVIGTGSSAVQLIPEVAKQVLDLTVYQRTATYALPSGDKILTMEDMNEIKSNYKNLREKARKSALGVSSYDMPSKTALAEAEEERNVAFERAWNAGGAHLAHLYKDIMVNTTANNLVSDFIKKKIKSIVVDPMVAEYLFPHSFPFGSRRVCFENGYYDTFNRKNVSLVNLEVDPIVEITTTGIKTMNGEKDFDCIIFATGFDAMTGALTDINIVGRNGEELKSHWREGAKTYLGLAISGYPNFFIVTGPGSPSVLVNMVMAIEQHVDWITDCIKYVRAKNACTIEATQDAEDKWHTQVNNVAKGSMFSQGKNSWYMGGNVLGKPKDFLPYICGLHDYGKRISAIAMSNYEGFHIDF